MPGIPKRLVRKRNPPPDIIVPDPEGRLVLITQAKWVHVLGDHGYLRERLNDVIKTIAQPDWISLRSGTYRPALAYYRRFSDMTIRVIVDLLKDEKFRLGTAYKANGPDLLREKVLWKNFGSI